MALPRRRRVTSTSAKTGWCITARSSAAIRAFPSKSYTKEDIRREYLTKKACAPYCTIACVHQVATFDNKRDPQTLGAKGAVRARIGSGDSTVYQIEQTEKAVSSELILKDVRPDRIRASAKQLITSVGSVRRNGTIKTTAKSVGFCEASHDEEKRYAKPMKYVEKGLALRRTRRMGSLMSRSTASSRILLSRPSGQTNRC